MGQDRVIFEEKLKRGLVPDGDGGWLTIDAAILKEKSRHRQSRLWDPNTVQDQNSSSRNKSEEENSFFKKVEEKEEVKREPLSEEILDKDPVEDTTEVELLDDDDDTAVHEFENIIPDTTIIEQVSTSDDMLASNETDTVALDRDELMREVVLDEVSSSELDGLAEDFGNIIDSFSESNSHKEESIEDQDDTSLEIEIEDLIEEAPVKINDADIDLPPSNNQAEEIIDLSNEFAKPGKEQPIVNDSMDEWGTSKGSIWPKILIPAILLISAAVLVATILIVT